MKLKITLPLFLLFTVCRAGAQESLSLSNAIELALKNNYSISISKNEEQIRQNDVTWGNAGALPQVSLNASGNFASNNTQQHYSSGLEVNKTGVASNGLNSGIFLNWTLFDGMKMFATYQRLRELSDMGLVQTRMQVEQTVASIISSYFEVVRQKELIRATNNSIAIYQERVKIAETKLNIGLGSKLDLLQAKADLNEQRSLLLQQQNAMNNAKASLNQLLALPADKPFDATDSLVITYSPQYEDLKTSTLKQNSGLLFAERNMNVYDLSVKEFRSQRYPRLGVNMSYNFTRSENQAGFVLLNQNLGFNAGFTATWNLFNGSNIERQITNAKLLALNSKLQYDLTRTQVESDLLRAYNSFRSALELLKLEEENSSLVKENVNVALESFRIGKISSIELKTAQKSYEDAQVRLVNARYQAKLAETELMRLNGILVK